MQTFTFEPEHWRIVRAFGRNPVVRLSDRVEAIVLVLAILGCIVGASIAGAVGTAVYDARRQVYSEQAQTRHPVTATALQDSTTVVDGSVYNVSVQWRVNAVDHTESFDWTHIVKKGDRVDIWVNGDGNRVVAPSPASQAGVDGARAGVALWLSVVAVAAALTGVVRWRLLRVRSADWERELASLQTNGDGRTNTGP